MPRINTGPDRLGKMRNHTVIFVEATKVIQNWNWWAWSNDKLGLCGLTVLPPDVTRDQVPFKRVVRRFRDKRGRPKPVEATTPRSPFMLPDTKVVGGPFDDVDAAIEWLNTEYGTPAKES